MPNIKSAKKRVKVIAAKRLRNKMVKSNLKTAIKRFDAAVASGSADVANSLFVLATSAIDKASSKGTIHKNAANRRKAQLAHRLSKISVAQ